MAPSRHLIRTLLSASLAVTGLATLAGCAPLVVGGAAATTAVVATDRRTAGEQVEDKAIEMKAGNETRKLVGERGRVNVNAYGGRVLLTGDVPTVQDRQRAQELTEGVAKVKQVFNQLRVGDITSAGIRTDDTWLLTKATTALINTQGVPTRTMSVVTERGVVYLMGRVTEEESQRATKVVKLFEIVSPESIAAAQRNAAPIQDGAAPANPPAPDADDNVQAIPVK